MSQQCDASAASALLCSHLSVSVRQSPVSSCDVLVLPVGQSSTSRAIKVTQKLWAAGVSSDIVYDVSQVSVHTLLGNVVLSQSKKKLALFCHIHK